ncbi:MAG: S1 RNA-binding domain-containing protein, partial [Erysipelotrichaceae bacterium]|nr:S1 RNA-binding domain-containing protein [Erysipelotrichaceae bacterium]
DIATKMVEDLTKTAEIGQIYDAKVVRLESYGAFVELFPGTDALVHVSDMRWTRVEKPSDLYKIGDSVQVKVTEIDEKGRVNASIKELLEKPEGYSEPVKDYSRKKLFGSNNNKGDRKKKVSK